MPNNARKFGAARDGTSMLNGAGMICRICHQACESEAQQNLCAECVEIKAALVSYYGSFGGVDFSDRREEIRAGAKELVESYRRAKSERGAYVH
jgi:hypothetical protein